MNWSEFLVGLLVAAVAYTTGWTTCAAVKGDGLRRRWRTRRLELDQAMIEAVSDAVAERVHQLQQEHGVRVDGAAIWSKVQDEIAEHRRRTGRTW